MAQRHMCPSMGALRRSLVADVPLCPSRAFHGAARRLEEQPSGAAPTTPAPTTRKARSEIALKQITNLQNRRAAVPSGGLARGNFPSGQHVARRTPRAQTDEFGFLPEGDVSGSPGSTGRLRITREATGPPSGPGGPAPPAGRMVRAPSQLRVTRNAAPGGAPRGPNLRGRGAPGGGARKGGPNKGGDGGPKRREKKAGGGGDKPRGMTIAETPAASTLSDGMVHNLLRLQRKEWDRVQYEPKYYKGSFAANELIHAGRELFKGESNPIKVWGPLEKQIGVVGMFGAEATLKIRRVGDGDEEPFGQEKFNKGKDYLLSSEEGGQAPSAPAER
ncbi:hypothetical protein NX059_003962 [Plenodomus lindquistii]|nr:hypothetical protein NX059_003962 [Plenodomus lindquistii]